MRIEKITLKNYGGIENFSASFSKRDRLIYVVDGGRSDDPFVYSGFAGVWNVFFGDALKVDAFGETSPCLEFVCERDGNRFALRAESCFKETKRGGKVTVTQGVRHSVSYPETLDKEKTNQVRILRDGYLYPQKMRGFGSFSPYYEDFNYTMEMLCREVELGDDCGYLSKEEVSSLKGKLRKFLRKFKPIPLTENYLLGFEKDGSYQVLNESGAPVYDLSADERTRAEFLSWVTALSWIREAAAGLGREGEYPVLAQGLFWMLDEGKEKKMLFDGLRKAGVQAFVLAEERNAELEKYFDKVLVLE